MNTIDSHDPHGELIEPTTLRIRRVVQGPIERVWAHLTDGDLRRRWLAAGDMRLEAGAPFELIWRNDELTDPPGRRPEGFSAEHRLESRILAVDPPRRLVFSWFGDGEVTFELEPAGDRILLTVTHRRLEERSSRLNVSAGWHCHLDLLAARLADTPAPPFWDGFAALRADYDERLPK